MQWPETKNTAMNLNSLPALLTTGKPRGPAHIKCPRCGAKLSIRDGGYQMHLTAKVRDHLNGSLGCWGASLLEIELALQGKNLVSRKWPTLGGYLPRMVREAFNRNDDLSEPEDIELPPDTAEPVEVPHAGRHLLPSGAFTHVHGEPVVKEMIARLDFSDLIGLVQQTPGLDEKTTPEVFSKAMLRVMSMMEGAYRVGPGLDVMLELPKIRALRKTWERDPGVLKPFVAQVAPCLSAYMDRFEQQTAKDAGAQGAVKRARMLLALALGHLAADPNSVGLHDALIRHNVPLTLPRAVPVSFERLRDLCLSEVLLGGADVFSPELATFLKASADEKPANPLAAAAEQLLHELGNVVDFVCPGLVGDLTPGANGAREICGWSAKAHHTSSVTMAGCPGCSKTMTMSAAMAGLEDCIAAIGATFKAQCSRDRAELRRMLDGHHRGVLRAPTKLGARNSIGLAVRQVTGQEAGTLHSIEFNDPPGEDWTQALEAEGSKPWVLGSLRGTQTVVLFFDLILEPSVRDAFLNSKLAANWKTTVGAAHEAVMKSRGHPALNQFALFEQILADLETFRGVEDLNIIVVIPKADLFTSQNRDDSGFFNPVFEALRTWGVLMPAEHALTGDPEDWSNCVTKAGFGADKIPNVTPKDGPLERQIKLMEEISKVTRTSLLNIHKALGPDATRQSCEQLRELIQVRLIERVERIFKGGAQRRVFWLPVSAVGRDHSSDMLAHCQTKNVQSEFDTGRPLTSKLAEYVVLGPIVLALAAEVAAKAGATASAPTNGNGHVERSVTPLVTTPPLPPPSGRSFFEKLKS